MKTLDENRLHGVWLQIDTYDLNNNCVIKQFEVPKWWLEKQMKTTLTHFLDNYTSEDSSKIYDNAIIEKVIMNESESK